MKRQSLSPRVGSSPPRVHRTVHSANRSAPVAGSFVQQPIVPISPGVPVPSPRSAAAAARLLAPSPLPMNSAALNSAPTNAAAAAASNQDTTSAIAAAVASHLAPVFDQAIQRMGQTFASLLAQHAPLRQQQVAVAALPGQPAAVFAPQLPELPVNASMADLVGAVNNLTAVVRQTASGQAVHVPNTASVLPQSFGLPQGERVCFLFYSGAHTCVAALLGVLGPLVVLTVPVLGQPQAARLVLPGTPYITFQ